MIWKPPSSEWGCQRRAGREELFGVDIVYYTIIKLIHCDVTFNLIKSETIKMYLVKIFHKSINVIYVVFKFKKKL